MVQNTSSIRALSRSSVAESRSSETLDKLVWARAVNWPMLLLFFSFFLWKPTGLCWIASSITLLIYSFSRVLWCLQSALVGISETEANSWYYCCWIGRVRFYRIVQTLLVFCRQNLKILAKHKSLGRTASCWNVCSAHFSYIVRVSPFLTILQLSCSCAGKDKLQLLLRYSKSPWLSDNATGSQPGILPYVSLLRWQQFEICTVHAIS